jgi:hypothetical protein
MTTVGKRSPIQQRLGCLGILHVAVKGDMHIDSVHSDVSPGIEARIWAGIVQSHGRTRAPYQPEPNARNWEQTKQRLGTYALDRKCARKANAWIRSVRPGGHAVAS